MKFLNTELRWPTIATPPITQAQLRVRPDDFVVEEVNNIALSGAGEHLWLQVRKRGANTDFVARRLAHVVGVPPRAVSYAGMKDRHAVTTQWFSIHLPGRDDPDLAGQFLPEIELLAMQRHARKLQRGALKGNRFRIVLRACSGDPAALRQRLEQIAQQGVPNYFGEQRFGRDGENLARAEQMFRGATVRDRHLRGIYLSAARSLIFNEVLAHRLNAGTWVNASDGEVFILNGTNSFFVADAIDAEITRRLLVGDIHLSGPLWGEGEPPSAGPVLVIERDVAQGFSVLAAGLAHAGMKQERRSLRVIPGELEAQWLDSASLALSFSLPAGCFATAVLREIADYHDLGVSGLAADEA